MIKDYFEYCQGIMDEVVSTELGNIQAASDLVVESVIAGGRLFVFGTGHSHMIAEELYLRAGGLALVHAMLEDEVMLHQMANKSTFVERLSGYASELLSLYNVSSEDTLLVVSNSGRNNVVVEMCLAAKEIGCHLIVLTSLESGESRHHSGLKISDLGDVVLNNHAPQGDAGFVVGDYTVGAVSTLTGVLLVQAMMVAVVDKLNELGFEVPVFKSSNIDGAQGYNNQLFKKYYNFRK